MFILSDFIYHGLFLLAAIAGISRWRMSDIATRIFTVVISITLVIEVVALILAKVYHNNLLLYRMFGPVELLGYCLYLNYCIPQLQRYSIGWIAGIAGIVTAIMFECLFPDDHRGAYFLMVETVLIICGCLYACFTMLLQENDESPTRYTHFWLVASQLFFWCFSFLSLALYNPDDPAWIDINHLLTYLIRVGNFMMLVGVIYTFIRLPKLLPSS